MATVKGDMHDIGKNIVKTVLENYGYTILDLGRNVPPEKIAAVCREEKIALCGLSALMTTTVVFMEETIRLLRRECPACRVMVGGAVLTADYAKKDRSRLLLQGRQRKRKSRAGSFRQIEKAREGKFASLAFFLSRTKYPPAHGASCKTAEK